MSLKAKILDDVKQAMRDKDAPRLSALRLLSAAIKQQEVDERKELTDVEVVAVVQKALKQRRDSITQYEAAGRDDLAETERFEVSVLQAYLPAQLSDDEIRQEVAAVVAEVGAAGPQDMGKVMPKLKDKLAGRADMGRVSAVLKDVLATR